MVENVFSSFENCFNYLYNSRIFRKKFLFIYGIGYSMGCKLYLFIGSLFFIVRVGNIFIFFNNFVVCDVIFLVE